MPLRLNYALFAIALALVVGCSKSTDKNDRSTSVPNDRVTAKVENGQRAKQTTEPAETNGKHGVEQPVPEPTKPDPKQLDLKQPQSDSQKQSDGESGNSEQRVKVFALLEQMSSDAAVERRSASQALDELGEAGIPFVVQGLRDGTLAQKRGAATYLIGRVSPRDQDALQALILALLDPDEALRHAALQAVEKVNPEQLALALPALLAVAKNSKEADAYRSRAIRAIGKLGSQGKTAANSLMDLARNDASLPVRRGCLFAISKVAPAQVAERFFRKQLHDNDTADLRRLSAKWLAGVASEDASIEALIGAFQDSDEQVRLAAVDSLVAIGKPSLKSLIKSLESSAAQTRRYSVLTIGKLGLLARDAVPALKKCLDDQDEQVRSLASEVLKVLK